jgi:Rrf2 family protein
VLSHRVFYAVLSRKAKYALKALVVMTRNGEAMQIGKIAESERLPKKFLELILLELRNQGILCSKRGKNGGYAFLRKPAEVNVAEVIRIIDGPMAFTLCSSKMFYEKCSECRDELTCEIRQVMVQTRIAFCEVLEKTTLQDLVNEQSTITNQPSTITEQKL